MNKYVRGYLVGLLSAFVVFNSISVFAGDGLSTISVMLNKINIAVNGSNVAKIGDMFTLDNGEKVPFSILYKGTTYLPLRKLGSLVGKDITWTGDTNTAGLNDKIVPTPAPTPSPTPVSFLKVGDTANFAEWDYTVLSVETHQNLSSSYTSNLAKGKYIVAIVKFTNHALYEREVGTKWLIRDELGRIFSLDLDASLGYYFAFNPETYILDDIGSSFSGTVALVFDVPIDAKQIVLYPTMDYKGNPAPNSKGVLLME